MGLSGKMPKVKYSNSKYCPRLLVQKFGGDKGTDDFVLNDLRC